MSGGNQLGRYTLLDRIAAGGMAEIFLAQVTGEGGFQKLCVLKRVLPHLTHAPGFVQMFLDEARIVARLNHPGIVQIFDIAKEGESYFIAMEYLAGEDLAAVLQESAGKQQRVPFEVAAKIVSLTAEALHYAHEAKGPDGQPLNIVHRDISPSNIFVTYQGAVKLLDFGIARAERRLEQTQVGHVKGKQAYMSPEQASGQIVDRRSDVWGLGVCLWELLTGRRLFARDSTEASREAVLNEEIPDPRVYRPDLPEPLREAVMNALERDLATRTRSADALRRQLERFLSDRTYVSSSAHLAEFMRGLFGAQRAESRLTRKPAQASRPPTERIGDAKPAEVTVPQPITEPDVKPRRSWMAPVLVLGAIGAALAGGFVLGTRNPAPALELKPPEVIADFDAGPPVVEAPVLETEPAPVVEPVPEPEPVRKTAAKVGTLVVESAQPGEVFVDGRKVGAAPAKLKLPPGNHSVQLVSAALGKSRTSKVAVRAGETATFKEAFAVGKLNVSVAPWADVFLDGAAIGQTPLAGRSVAAGPHTLKLSSPAGEKSLHVEVPEGASVTVKETLP